MQIMAESQLGEALADDEADKIVAFLESLTGSFPAVTIPTLPPESATTPRPTVEIRP